MTATRGTETATQGSNLAAAYSAYVRELEKQDDDHLSIHLMSFEYQAKARGRQLDTLLHLSHFSDYLVLVSAPSGAGKSTFIEQFLRVQPAEAHIVHLCLSEEVGAVWVVDKLVQQLPVQLPVDAGLEESIQALQGLAQSLTSQEQVLLLVVDNAHWLDEDALELLANVLPRSAKVDARPHVVLCADQSLVERIEAPQYAEMRQERFYHLVLAPFSQEESADYLRQRLQAMGIAQGQGLAPIQLLQLHQLAKGNPGYLNMLAKRALNKGGFVQQTGLPLLHIGATIVVVLILAGIWLFNTYGSQVEEALLSDDIVSTQESEQASSPVEYAELEEVIEPIAEPLPPLEPIRLSEPSPNVSLKPAELAPKQDKKPVAEPSVNKPVAKPANEPAPKPVIKPVVEAASTPKAEPKPKPKLPSWPKVTAKAGHPYSYDALLKLPSDHYSLQVLGARLEPTLEAFLTAHKFKQPYYVVQLERSGAPWYLLLVGDYTNSDDARAAVKSLPLVLRNQQPWPREVLKIQQQIRNKFNTSGE